MNPYGSANRGYLASNIIEGVINPPNDLVLSYSAPAPRIQLLQSGAQAVYPFLPPGTADWNIQANLIIHRAGIFSNFADGLVMLTPAVRPSIIMYARPYIKVTTPLAGTASLTPGTRNMVGVGTFWLTPGPSLLSAGDVVLIDGIAVIIESVTSNTTATITQYAEQVSTSPLTGVTMYKIALGPFASQSAIDWVYNVAAFNYLYDCERFIPASVIGGATSSGFLVFCTIRLAADLTLGTISIDPAWAGKPVFFDVHADVEINWR